MNTTKTYAELNTEFMAVEQELSELYAKIEELNAKRGELRVQLRLASVKKYGNR
ncbi:hypothetical protein SEA_MORTYSMITH_61 [Microbacterium phage MortySmith]|nr:hypothetical protein SEA_AESIR_62 [Microbacterium phage Aesir]QPX61908.1 hypothetical protein SEA_DANNYDE_64 [Microbacterium phage DannyDe]WNM68270.1 hypothetical protein SEA_JDAWG_62 [Microbacterium phage JDawG]